jgi:hypothetical protein
MRVIEGPFRHPAYRFHFSVTDYAIYIVFFRAAIVVNR